MKLPGRRVELRNNAERGNKDTEKGTYHFPLGEKVGSLFQEHCLMVNRQSLLDIVEIQPERLGDAGSVVWVGLIELLGLEDLDFLGVLAFDLD